MGMDAAARAGWWDGLPAGIREQIDGYVLQDSFMVAVKAVLDIGRVPHGIGIDTAQLIVNDRFERHADRIARSPRSPLDLASLARRAAGAAGRVVAVEAVWDGDTVHDWFVELLAVTAGPDGRTHLATVHHATARAFLGADARDTARRPSAVAAERAGRALAAHLAVPFHFASPDVPDDNAPRRRP
ncbi:hypothetical protein ACFYVL_29915 [Streptomyces sp. NPDC004111]|uniref:hypothetical protein n=1 Tax=Streptomyces sp. NPDC004111 TaxID=3364690 RepID=UPI0036BC3A2E